MALVAIVNIHNFSALLRGDVSNDEALEDALYRDPIINVAVPIQVLIRMSLESNNSRAGYARRDSVGFG